MVSMLVLIELPGLPTNHSTTSLDSGAAREQMERELEDALHQDDALTPRPRPIPPKVDSAAPDNKSNAPPRLIGTPIDNGRVELLGEPIDPEHGGVSDPI
jgi:hypothetical protein